MLDAMDKVLNGNQYTDIMLCRNLGFMIPDHEGLLFKHYCAEKLSSSDSESESLTLLDRLNACKKDVFPNVHKLLVCLSVCPISSVTVERFFSKLNHIMIPSRQSMTTKRLNNLCVLSFERDIVLTLERNLHYVRKEYEKLNKK